MQPNGLLHFCKNTKSRFIGGFVALCMVALQFLGVVHQISHNAYLKNSTGFTETNLSGALLSAQTYSGFRTSTFSTVSSGYTADSASAFDFAPSSAWASNASDSFGHSNGSKDCQLFDGLAVSCFVASNLFIVALLNKFLNQFPKSATEFLLRPASPPYSSRAPPKH